MRKKEIREILSSQTDLILLNENLFNSPTGSYSSQDDQLESLLELAAALKETLIPLTNPSLKTRVRDTLANYSKPEVLLRRVHEIPAFWLVLAFSGSVISLIGLFILLLRKVNPAKRDHFRDSRVPQPEANGIN
ncbi:MAG: hypothetical protein BMS9Abin02_1341 [Anaerolineae bacterium]|nr:MAG: hypothetical protein BMS9Abin02_1341 [Anaerolineae bacterium]